MSRVIVIGAGAERHLGMPLANELVPELAKFTADSGEGHNINKKLREKLKNLRFDFRSFVEKSVKEFLEKQIKNPDISVDDLKKLKQKYPSDDSGKVDFLIEIGERIRSIGQSNEIDEKFAKQIEKVIDKEVKDESLIRLRGIQLTDDPESAIHKILEGTVYGTDLNNELDRELQKYILATIFPFEKLLMDNFAGFYTGDNSRKKKYLYMAWCLWAYLRIQMNHIDSKGVHSPFYKQINNDGSHVITFNYTDFFARNKHPKVSYFHGDCKSYIRYSNRDFITADYSDLVYHAETPERVWEMLDALSFQIDTNDFPIPAIVPPLTFKPVFSSHYIKKWAEAGDALENCNSVVIVGYSFAQADEHFNDLLRRAGRNKEIYVVNPSADDTAKRVAEIFGMSEDFEKTKHQGFDARLKGKLTIIGAKAEELDFSKLP